MPIQYTNHQQFNIFEDNLNAESSQDTFTGNYWSSSNENSDCEELSPFSETTSIVNLPDPVLQMNMSGRNRPELREHNLSWANDLSDVITIKIGTPSRMLQNQENWTLSRQTYLFAITAVSRESVWIMLCLLRSSERFWYSVVRLESENQDELGLRRVWKLILRTQTQNFGMATVVRNTLFSMSFAELLISRMFSDGSIDIQYSLKLREARAYLRQRRFGLRQIFIPVPGTQTWIPEPRTHSSGALR